MNISRRDFLGGIAAASTLAAAPGCCTKFGKCCRPGKVAVQLYSVRNYIGGKMNKGLPQTLADLKAIGYEGVEFAGYYGYKPAELKKMLCDNGLAVCGTHVGRQEFSPENIQKTLDFELGYGNKFICCPGGGNLPPGFGWDGNGKADKNLDKWMKELCDYYNVAAETAAKSGAMIGLHNHMWEFQIKLASGETYWDYFFRNTSKLVQMEQDVGWTTCAGFDPCEQYKKYPGRAFTLHAKENGMGKDVKEFNAVLGQPGKPGAIPVAWDKLFPITDADNVQWYVVECERQCDTLNAVRDSFAFLKSKGRV